MMSGVVDRGCFAGRLGDFKLTTKLDDPGWMGCNFANLDHGLVVNEGYGVRWRCY